MTGVLEEEQQDAALLMEEESESSYTTIPETSNKEQFTSGTMLLLWEEFHQSVDTEMILITLALYIISIIFLSPRGSYRGFSLRRRRRIPEANHSPRTSRLALHPQDELQQQQEQEGICTRTTTTLSTNDGTSSTPEEDESDEETFEKLWPVLSSSNYGKLVLPPDCKLVDVPTANVLKKQHEEIKKIKRKDSMDEDEEDYDHPLTRLRSYVSQLISLARQFLSYDFIGAGRVLMSWISFWVRPRRKQVKEEDADDDEDDDGTATDSAANTTDGSICETPPNSDRPIKSISNLSDISRLDGEAKWTRNNSITSSVYETPITEEGDEKTEQPPSAIRMPKHLMAKISGKKKDALDPYRALNLSPVPFFNSNSAAGPISPLKSSDVLGCKTEPSVGFRFDESDDDKHEPLLGTIDGNEEERRSESMTFFDAAHSRASLRRMHVEVPVPDRNGYILGDDFLAGTQNTPLLVFVNSRSGPQQGQLLIGQLRRLLNPIQVWDLAKGEPTRILESFCVLSRLRILVCGGDGTVSWIISCLEKMNLEKWPPIAVLPLGTGNDLARTHGWGGGYNHESLIVILEQVAESYISLLDRWLLTTENKKGKIKETKSFFNYMGIGADAQAALQVHMLRDSTPTLFFSRLVNKMWYLLFGAEETIKQSNINLPNEITLIADGVEVPLPSDSQGIIVLNVDSFAGGIPIWSHGVQDDVCPLPRMAYSSHNMLSTHEESPSSAARRKSTGNLRHDSFGPDTMKSADSSDDDMQEEDDDGDKHHVFACDRPSSCQDGMLDIVSVRGAFHLGQIRVGLSNALRLCQAREVEIVIKKKVAIQIDGEPWRQSPVTMKVKRKKDPAVMLHRSANESGGVETEMAKLLDWAEERKVIDRNVHSILTKEFSRRIESKTRQRRVKSQDNLMLSLKRAITSGGGHSSQPIFPGTLSF